MTCTLCKSAAKLRGRKCAFLGNGRFTSDNWNCDTMAALRGSALWSQRDDLHSGSIAVVLLPDAEELRGYIVLSFYKDRGKVGAAVLMCDDEKPITLTRSIAEAAVRRLA